MLFEVRSFSSGEDLNTKDVLPSQKGCSNPVWRKWDNLKFDLLLTFFPLWTMRLGVELLCRIVYSQFKVNRCSCFKIAVKEVGAK